MTLSPTPASCGFAQAYVEASVTFAVTQQAVAYGAWQAAARRFNVLQSHHMHVLSPLPLHTSQPWSWVVTTTWNAAARQHQT